MMGLPGDTRESIQKTSDFAISLGLDDMNMSKFTPFYGAPVWASIFEEGTFDYDWRKMNCLNFVFVPRGIGSKDELDQLYNRHVKRFYTDPGWRRRFRKRTWEHRKSIIYFLRHLPPFLRPNGILSRRRNSDVGYWMLDAGYWMLAEHFDSGTTMC